ncbi:MAG: RCC1 domain-containing protein, partial [Candidatus Thalassarchaeaceae archaeon]
DDGTVTCWGYNVYGALGDGTTNDRNTPTQTSSLGTDRTAVTISTGYQHACAILDDESVVCWGWNFNGQLGDGTTTDQLTPTQTSSLGIDRHAVSISAGEYHTCAILDNGSVSCWGYNSDGQLGDGTNNQQNTPTQTTSLGTDRTAFGISAGHLHTCAILDNESISCWGQNGNGQLGDGTNTHQNMPTQTSSLGTNRTAVAISLGGHSCAILDDATISCWGYNVYGQLGDGTTTHRSTPTQTASLGINRTAVVTFHEHSGQSSQTACLAGTYQPNTGQISCLDTDAGYYTNNLAFTSQIECPVGEWQSNTGSTGCYLANVGHYVNSTASTNQTECAPGTYQPNQGQSSCLDADAGFYVDPNIYPRDNQTDCAVGTYQPDTGQTSCLDADAGYYVDTNASDSQTEC